MPIKYATQNLSDEPSAPAPEPKRVLVVDNAQADVSIDGDFTEIKVRVQRHLVARFIDAWTWSDVVITLFSEERPATTELHFGALKDTSIKK